MLLSEIDKFLKKEVSLIDFKKQLEQEIAVYKISLNKKGGSNPIILKEDFQTLEINETDIKFIGEAFLQNALDKWEINYLAEALLLSEKVFFQNEKVEEALYALTDPEFFNLVTNEYIKCILNDLTV